MSLFFNKRRAHKAPQRPVRHRLLLAGAGLLLSIAIAPWASAATYYVDQRHAQANDNNPGSAQQPWKSMTRAMSAQLQPGDTVIVKPGVYPALGGQWNNPALNPATSGTAEKPITFRAEPKHGAKLDPQGGQAAIGTNARNYVVIDGFEIETSGGLGAVIWNSKGVIMQNMKIHGMRGAGFGNTDGIRIERSRDSTVRNNLIYDITNDNRTTNAAGIKIYYSTNILIENNEIFDTIAGIKEKEEGVDVHVRRNYIHDCSVGMELNNQNSTTTRGYHFYQNIVSNCTSGFTSATQASAVMKDVFIYNNLFYNYSEVGITGSKHGINRRIWNNIFYREGSVRNDIVTPQDPPVELTLIDYNLYSPQPIIVLGLYVTNNRYTGLSTWQQSGLGYDQHSVVANPLLVNAKAADFRLAANSPARNAGRLDGNPSKAAVNMGPYITGNETIGLTSADGSIAPPSAPKLIGAK